MRLSEANKMLKKMEKAGLNRYNNGIVSNGSRNYGINIDGDGSYYRPTGCPKIIWDIEQAQEYLSNYILSN